MGDFGGTADSALDAVPAQPWRQVTPKPSPQPSADEFDASRERRIFRFLTEAEESKTRPVRTLDGRGRHRVVR
ncbi:hypothetical protein [Streptomyces sp.]|uniref:hypothetical protein n=1 Tax=Streptomyces sp. TaxID=1931 RepID=UPI002810DF89|nr:hypothetical protein [Streptomyces sp.]